MSHQLWRSVARIAVLLLPVLLSGCPKSLSVVIYNNTGQDLVIHYTDGDGAWTNGSLLRLAGDDLNRILWRERPDRMTIPSLRLSPPDAPARRYDLLGDAALPAGYESNGQESEEWFLQLQPDGRLYAVKPTDRFPADLPNPQPAGFPIPPAAE
jgi:hypothetical protein